MQPDLLGLEITKGELRRLSGVPSEHIIKQNKRFSLLLNELLICLAIAAIIVGFIYTFIIFPTSGSSIPLATTLIIIVTIIIALGRWLWYKKTYPKSSINLLNEVDKYHALIKKIDNNVEHTRFIVEALQLVREDLVKALKLVKLRQKKDLSHINSELLTNNLQALKAMQASNQDNQIKEILNQAMQIESTVEQEMRKLQGERSS